MVFPSSPLFRSPIVSVTVLFVAFEFPPLAGGGVQRSSKFAKYLECFQITPVVITTDAVSLGQIFDNSIDWELLKALPESMKIERIPCPHSWVRSKNRLLAWCRSFFSLQDGIAASWEPHLRPALNHIVQRHRPEAIYVTVPPFSMAPLWSQIARELSLPLVLDCRDALSQWRIGPYSSWLHYRLTLRLENRCLSQAARVICTSEQTRHDLLRVHPQLPSDKFTVITNGHDGEIQDWVPGLHRSRPQFVIGYVGSFYYTPAARDTMMRPWWRKRPNRMIQYAPRKEDWLYRSPWFFFKAVAHLFATHPEYKARLRIRFAGVKPDWIDSQVAEFGLGDNVEFLGRLDHPNVIQFQRECDALLVTSSKVVGGNSYSIAGKTFEYLSLGKPILGFVAQGAQEQLLNQTGMAIICDPDAPEASAQKLRDLIDGRNDLKPNVPFLKRLHRKELTRQLAGVLLSAVLQVT